MREGNKAERVAHVVSEEPNIKKNWVPADCQISYIFTVIYIFNTKNINYIVISNKSYNGFPAYSAIFFHVSQNESSCFSIQFKYMLFFVFK